MLLIVLMILTQVIFLMEELIVLTLLAVLVSKTESLGLSFLLPHDLFSSRLFWQWSGILEQFFYAIVSF